jgi:LacI family transcriptional regulator
MRRNAEIPHVAVWIEGSIGYSRGLIRGVSRYVFEHGPWSIYFTRHGIDSPVPSWLRRWSGDGILAQINDRKMLDLLSARHLPRVDLRGRFASPGLPFFGLDNQLVAQMAFDHLRERGFRHYGYCGLTLGQHRHMDRRCAAFRQCVAEAGFECPVHEAGARAGRASGWEHDQDRLGQWLLAQPKPVGIMASGDDRGHAVIDACRRVGLLVPDQVAVIGVDNDEEMCNLSTPALSSVAVHSERIGYAAAAFLDHMMRSGQRPGDQQMFPPSHVVTRLSTDIMAVDDPAVAIALRFIRDHACHGIRVDDVVRAASASRRWLERSFSAALGRTPNAEILRVRMRRAQELILDSDLSLEAIASKTGFSSQKYFSDVFLRATGQRPSDLRRLHAFRQPGPNQIAAR